MPAEKPSYEGFTSRCSRPATETGHAESYA